MAFFRRRTEGGDGTSATSRLTAVRDCVEIAAIVAAGVWAFYTFVYENQIKPAQSKPIVLATSSLERLGERHGLLAIDSRLSIKNAGLTDIYIYGFAETVSGSTIVENRTNVSHASAVDGPGRLLQSQWTASASTPIYEIAILTTLADRNSADSFDIRPGDTETVDRIVYVKAGAFDELQTRLSMRFSNRDAFVPCRIVGKNGRLAVEPAGSGDLDGFEQATAALSLWR